MNTELIDVNGYKMHPDLVEALARHEPAALCELRGEFTPDTGCGQDCAKLIDAYTAFRQGLSGVEALIDRGTRYTTGTATGQVTHAVAWTLAVYIFG